MNWQATNRKPISKASEVDELKFVGPENPTKKAREQLAAVKKAVAPVLSNLGGPVNVAASGVAAGKDGSLTDQVHVHVVVVDEP